MVTKYSIFKKETGNKKRFLRFQLTSIFATIVDFLMTLTLKEGLNLFYPYAVATGAFCGALTAFWINRNWVFRAFETQISEQGIRYLFVAAGSIVLNTAGTYLLTEITTFNYIISKALVALVIGFTYSYYFSKRYVYYA